MTHSIPLGPMIFGVCLLMAGAIIVYANGVDNGWKRTLATIGGGLLAFVGLCCVVGTADFGRAYELTSKTEVRIIVSPADGDEPIGWYMADDALVIATGRTASAMKLRPVRVAKMVPASEWKPKEVK